MDRQLRRVGRRVCGDAVVIAVVAVLVVLMSLPGGPARAQEPQVAILGEASTPEPPCFDNLNRYVDCGNGTVTDSVTGLVWLLDAACFGAGDWASGSTLVAGLGDGQCGLADGSRPGQWRLPTIDEWQATIGPAVAMGCSLEGTGVPPALTNAAGTGCAGAWPRTFHGVAPGGYWSMTSNPQHPNNAWVASLVGTLDGFVFSAVKSHPLHVWPVRAH